MGARRERLKRILEVGKVARSSKLLRVLREIGVAGDRPATTEAATEFRQALEELGTTYVKLGQLLSSRPDLMPDAYIEELTRLVDEVPPVSFTELEPVIRRELGESAFVLHAVEDFAHSRVFVGEGVWLPKCGSATKLLLSSVLTAASAAVCSWNTGRQVGV